MDIDDDNCRKLLNIDVRNNEWLPFRRLKGLIVSNKYPIVLAWGKSPLLGSWVNENIIAYSHRDDYTACWLVDNDVWEKLYKDKYSPDEECFYDYYPLWIKRSTGSSCKSINKITNL